MADAVPQSCPQCGQGSFDFEDTPIGLVCSCGYVIDDTELVHHQGYDPDGNGQGAGVHVALEDDGTRAGAVALNDGSRVATIAAGDYSKTLSVNKARLQQALSALSLPRHLQTAANDLLMQVLKLNARPETKRNTTAATVAAVVYLASREKQHALTLGKAGWALGVPGWDVAKEFRRITAALIDNGYMDEVPPPSLEALIKYTAVKAMPQYLKGQHEGNKLWQHPAVKKSKEVGELLQIMEVTGGRKPELVAAATVSLCLAEHFRDAKPSVYGGQIAQLLGYDRHRVQEQIALYQDELAPLVKLLPFASKQHSAAGFEAIKNAGTLLKLRHLLQQAKQVETVEEPERVEQLE